MNSGMNQLAVQDFANMVCRWSFCDLLLWFLHADHAVWLTETYLVTLCVCKYFGIIALQQILCRGVQSMCSSCVYRPAIVSTTLRVAMLGIVYGFSFSTSWIFRMHSTFISFCLWALPVQGRIRNRFAGILLDVACERVQNNFPTVCINAASAYQSGGGFLTGGRHALEESICIQATVRWWSLFICFLRCLMFGYGSRIKT